MCSFIRTTYSRIFSRSTSKHRDLYEDSTPGFPSLVINASLQSTLSETMVEHIRHHCWSSYVHKSSELAWYTIRAWMVSQAGNTCYATRNTSWPQSPLPKRTPERPHVSLCRRPLHIIFLRHPMGEKSGSDVVDLSLFFGIIKHNYTTDKCTLHL